MAVFGVQVVVTMIVASFLHKLTLYYSFGRWFITFRLHRYLTPSDEMLRPFVTVSSSNQKGKRKNYNQQRNTQSSASGSSEVPSTFKDPKCLNPSLMLQKSSKIKLHNSSIDRIDLALLHYSSELEWMFNFTLAAVSVVGITGLYYYLDPDALQTQYNLSTIWLLLVCIYILCVLGSLTKVYMSEELAHQRSVCIVFTSLFFVLALVILLIDEGILDLGLEKTYANLSKCIARLIGRYVEEEDEVRFVPIWVFKLVLALCGTLFSFLLIFPGLRFADVHFNALRYTKSKILKAFLHATYISPMFCLSLWIRPLSSDMLAERSNVNVFGFYEVTYENFRIGTVLGVCLLRLAMYHCYMQTYLDTAKWRLEEMRYEHGRISVRDLRKNVTNIFLFYCGMGVQYIAPYLLLFCMVLLMYAASLVQYDSVDTEQETNSDTNVFKFSGFGVSVFYGCFSFFCWWICLVQTVTTGLGAVLREYL